MLGRLPLAKFQRLRNDLETKCAGVDGDLWYSELTKFLRRESCWIEKRWRQVDGVIYFSVESDGTPGEDWVFRLDRKDFRMDSYAKQVVRSPSFMRTSGVTTEVAVLKGMLFEERERITKNVLAAAERMKLRRPNAELACLFRLKFTNKDIEAMGLGQIVAMHEPINDSEGGPHLLCADNNHFGLRLSTAHYTPDRWWNRDTGFAFVVRSYRIGE
jgi:hypothetical protein